MKTKEAIKAELESKIAAALASGDEKELVNAFTDFAMNLQQDIMKDAEDYKASGDKEILARRGVRVLTSEETKYYNELIKAMKSADVKMALTDMNVALPETVIESVEDNMITAFPLLDAVDFQGTNAITKMIYNAQGTQKATWGALNTAIATELAGQLKEIDVTHCKLTAFMFVNEDMLDEGPQWIDAYVRGILTESFGLGFCYGVIAGNGKDQPIGMLKDLAKPVTEGVYADKDATAVTNLDVTTFGSIAASLATDVNGRPRTVSDILLVVNPIDYFQKIMPASTYLTNVGTYVNNVFPYPVTLVQDVNVPSGKAIFGLGKQYKLFSGLGGKSGQITYSDEYKFLEEYRTYKVKAYANGLPADNNAFYIADISKLKAL